MSKLKIFGIPWHLGNQAEMLKLADHYDVEFYYLENNVRRFSRFSHRPLKNINWVQYYEPGKYDLAMLHLDQQCTDPDIGKGQLYRQLNEVIQDIPKIVINHGTPMWDDERTDDMVINGGDIHTTKGVKRLDGMKDLVGDNFMVVNSYEAVIRWGWGYPLIHGMTPEEWWDLPKEPRVVLSLSPGGLDKYYNRQLISYIKSYLKEKVGISVIHTNVDYAPKDWDDYRELLGTSLISISPYKDSPMPRSRTEAMFSGSCIMTSRHQNADEFIEHGVNGFIVPDNPLSYVEAIGQLINYHYNDAIEIGQRGKETAKKYFTTERYLKDLYKIVKGVANGTPPVWDGQKIWSSAQV